MKYYQCSTDEALKELQSSIDGLSKQEAAKRQEKYGTNELEQKKKTSPWMLFLNQFKSFIIYILLFAIVLSLLSKEHVDAIVILIIVFFNAVFGFIQEYKAGKAIDALKRLSGLQATVKRNAHVQNIDARSLVPGDIIIVEEGMKVPADARLLTQEKLYVSEASLTGEAIPVSKVTTTLDGNPALAERHNMLYSGTLVTRGRGVAVVVRTGMATEIGKIAEMISEVETAKTPLQRQLEKLGKHVGIGTLSVCALVFIIGTVTSGVSLASPLTFLFQSKEWLLTAVSLAVAAVPEGLPAIVTIALALGVRRMVTRNALIRHLPSVETLGETTVICSDKTGTLTKNEMTVNKIFVDNTVLAMEGTGLSAQLVHNGKHFRLTKTADLLFSCGVLCNDATLSSTKESYATTGDPTESALLVSAVNAGLSIEKLRKQHPRTDVEPFDPVRKMMSTSHGSIMYVKGAPEAVLRKCTYVMINGKRRKITAQFKRKILEQNETFASEALRVLAFAYRTGGKTKESQLTFLGLQAMRDPPHEEVTGAIERCHAAGIRVIMITGDNITTAKAIGNEIGIIGDAIEGTAFAGLKRSQQLTVLQRTTIFARVAPEHKLRIVSLLQEQGEIVAMTGDGVNDAPAIKKADLGIAMGLTGTDVAKEASDMVLQDDNFTSIVNAVEEGRGIYANISKFVNYLLSSNLSEVMVIFFAILFGWPLPMTAVMLLWLNLVTDGLPALALSVDPTPSHLMQQPPKKPEEGILNKRTMLMIGSVAVLITIAVLALYRWATVAHMELAHVQTVTFTALILMELVRLQTIRSEYQLGMFSNWYLVGAVIASLGLQVLVIYSPLSAFFGTTPLFMIDWIMIAVATFALYIINGALQRVLSRST